jgi:DNA-binding response OmpR family regulator
MTCILLVEDENDIREMLAEFLQDEGHDIIEATTGDAALALLHVKDLRLVVTDINLPGEHDGISLVQIARKTHPGIPVIFISGRPATLLKAQVLGNPAAFLQKPFTLKALLGDIRRLADRT